MGLHIVFVSVYTFPDKTPRDIVDLEYFLFSKIFMLSCFFFIFLHLPTIVLFSPLERPWEKDPAAQKLENQPSMEYRIPQRNFTLTIPLSVFCRYYLFLVHKFNSSWSQFFRFFPQFSNLRSWKPRNLTAQKLLA